jgi:hypothetical protein
MAPQSEFPVYRLQRQASTRSVRRVRRVYDAVSATRDDAATEGGRRAAGGRAQLLQRLELRQHRRDAARMLAVAHVAVREHAVRR